MKTISESEILQDITDTEMEIDDLRLKKELNPRLAIGYQAKIEEREVFIGKLKELLKDARTTSNN